MATSPSMREQLLLKELQDLRRQLEEPEELLRALRSGEVDAFVVPEPTGEKIYALRSADPLYRLMIEQMKEGALTLSAEGTIVYCNFYFAELVRVPRETLLGASAGPFFHPPSRAVFEALLQQAAADGGPRRAELVMRAGDGGQIPVYVTVNVLPVQGVQVYCVIVTDLTEQKRHEEVVAARDPARSILEQAAEAIVVCDEAGQVIEASRAAHDLCGASPVRRPFDQVLPLRTERDADGGPGFSLGPVLAGQTLRGVEVYFTAPSGRSFELLLGAGPLRHRDGRVIGCVVTLTDIGRQKQAEEVLRQADRRKDEYLAMLAHELRNPLAPMRNALH